MALLSACNYKMKFLLASQICEFTNFFFSEDLNPNIQSSAVAEAAYTDHWTPLKVLLGDSLLLLEIEGWYSSFEVGNKPHAILVVNEAGALTSEQVLPPFCTVNIMKVPDNDTMTPGGGTPFRQGFTGIPGIPEAAQQNGLLTPTAQGDFDAMGEVFESLDVNDGTADQTYTLGMYRAVPSTGINQHVMVAETYANAKIGTRNSRKR